MEVQGSIGNVLKHTVYRKQLLTVQLKKQKAVQMKPMTNFVMKDLDQMDQWLLWMH